MYPQIIRNEKVSAPILVDIAKRRFSRKILLVHGKNSFLTCGAKNEFDLAFKNNFITFDFTDFSENPKLEDVNKGIMLAKEFQPDLIFGIGGGSALDVAKLIRFYYSPKDVYLCLIPTTSGTGAESTKFAVCYEDGEKKSISNDDILSNEVVLDWTLTKTNSDYTTACTGFDALAQAIESYWAVKATETSKKLAKKAIEIIFPILDKRELYHTDDFRKQMHWAANISGQAINISTTTACHAFSYKITSLFGLPHGHAVAISMPYFFDYAFSNAIGDMKNTMRNLTEFMNIEYEPRKFFSDYVKKAFTGLYKPRIPTNDEWDIIFNGVNVERLVNFPLKLGKIQKDDFLW